MLGAHWILVLPLRKWLAAGVSERRDQIANSGATDHKFCDQFIELLPIAAVPLRRNILTRLAQKIGIEVFDSREPGLKRTPSSYLGIDMIARINAAQRRVREGPFTGIKTIPLVNKGDV